MNRWRFNILFDDMTDVKSELQYLITIDLLEEMTAAGLLKEQELVSVKKLIREHYCPKFVHIS